MRSYMCESLTLSPFFSNPPPRDVPGEIWFPFFYSVSFIVTPRPSAWKWSWWSREAFLRISAGGRVGITSINSVSSISDENRARRGLEMEEDKEWIRWISERRAREERENPRRVSSARRLLACRQKGTNEISSRQIVRKRLRRNHPDD